MFPTWRLQLHEAKLAFQRGRLDESSHLLRQHGLLEFLPGQRLSGKVARSMVERAERRAAMGDSSGGWRDLKAAASLGGPNPNVDLTRGEFIEKALAEAERLLLADDPQQALARLDRLEQHGADRGTTRPWRGVIEAIRTAQLEEKRAKFAAATKHWARAAALGKDLGAKPLLAFLEEHDQQCRVKADEHRRLTEDLYHRLADEPSTAAEWTAVLTASESLLALAPGDSAAKRARTRAWEAAGLKSSRSDRRFFVSGAERGSHKAPTNKSTRGGRAPSQVDTVINDSTNQRFLMWVDGVGGFLALTGDRIVVGQPSNDGAVDLPIRADISRRHCIIRREHDGYVLEPIHALASRPLYIDGHPIEGPTSLVDGNLVDLGHGVQMRYRRPHALSATARLEIVSHHKTQPTVDAVLLMSDTCILGPQKHCHVQCDKWQHDVVLYRQSEEMFCRSQGELQIDGQPCEAPASVSHDAQIEGEDFTIRLEST